MFDFAYYGNTIASSTIVSDIVSNATPLQTSAIELGIFALFSLPAFTIERIGHRLLQIVGFAAMAVLFLLVWAIPGASTEVGLFVIIFGASYFFAQFGPNTTTFVIPSESFPADVRTTGNGIASGVAKVGTFGGAALLPALVTSSGPTDMILVPAALMTAAALLSLLLPEPSGTSLEKISDDSLTAERQPNAKLSSGLSRTRP